MKNLGKYVAGLTGVVVFLYLLNIGEKDLATQLFYALLSVFSLIFGIEHGRTKTIEKKEYSQGEKNINSFEKALLKKNK